MGTPAIAVPYLEALHPLSQIQAVVTSPDQPAGRGYEVKATAVKEAAQRLGLPVLQPSEVKSDAIATTLRQLKADVAIVVAYGKLLPPSILATTVHGFLNVHFSLLPAYRGAAPIQWALLDGRPETGVSLFWLDEGMDTGPLVAQQAVPVTLEDDAETLRSRLVPVGIHLMQETLRRLEQGEHPSQPQVGTPTAAPMLKKEDGRLLWSKSAKDLFNVIRATTPWPGAFCLVPSGNSETVLKVIKASPLESENQGQAGEITSVERGKSFVVRCGQGSLNVLEVQPAGKKAMSAWSWWQGARLKTGDRLR